MKASWWVRISDFFKSKDVKDRAALAEDVAFGLGANNDIEAIRATAELTTSLCNNGVEAAVDGHFFVYFKVKNAEGNFQIFHKRLTIRERAILNRSPSLLQKPQELLGQFERYRAVEIERAAELRSIVKPDR